MKRKVRGEGMKLLHCPFCNRDVETAYKNYLFSVVCECGYKTPHKFKQEDAENEHNRVAKAVMESEAS